MTTGLLVLALLQQPVVLGTPVDEGVLLVRMDTLEVARESFRISRGRLSGGTPGWSLATTIRYDRARPVIVLSPILEVNDDTMPVTLQYDVADPFKPKLTGKVRIGGVVSRASHPGAKNGALSGAPQMVEISRDGKRVYFTNSLYGNIDSQLYPDGIDGWMVKLDAKPAGGIAFDPKFFVEWPKSHRPHQVRLDGGDCSSDSYCYP